MRRFFIGMVVAATTVLLPALALAENQEIAEQIAGNLRESGQLQGYKIGVKFQDGTAWIRGRVTSKNQIAKVLKLVWSTDGVDRVVNRLEVARPAATTTAKKSEKTRLKTPKGTLKPEQVARRPSTSQERYSGDISRTARRLQQVVDGKLAQLAERTSVPRANRLASSYTPRPARPASAVRMVQPATMPQATMQPAPIRSNRPVPVAYIGGQAAMMRGAPMPAQAAPMASGAAPVRYDQPCMPNCAWPSYASYPNYAAVTYPKQYSPTAWPFIGPFYPYPQVPLGWRKVTLEWDDGWWMLDFKDSGCH